MGNEQGKVDGNRIKFRENKKHFYLGNIKVYEALGHERKVAAVTSKIQNAFDVLDHTSLRHQNLISVLSYDSGYADMMGVKDENVPYYFDLYETSLAEIIEARKKFSKRFEAIELKRIMFDILNLLAFYEEKHSASTHWNINTSTIFYDRISKIMKVYDNQVIQGKYACFYQHFEQIRSKKQSYQIASYCTPEIAAALERCYHLNHIVDLDLQKSDRDFMYENKQKIDIFLLGLTILECGTYLPSNQLYDEKNFTIKSQELGARLKIFQSYYGEELTSYMKLMLHENISLRPMPSYFISAENARQEQKVQQQQQALNMLRDSQQVYQFYLNKQQSQQQSIGPLYLQQQQVQVSQVLPPTASNNANSQQIYNRIRNQAQQQPSHFVSPHIATPQGGLSRVVVSVSPCRRSQPGVLYPQTVQKLPTTALTRTSLEGSSHLKWAAIGSTGVSSQQQYTKKRALSSNNVRQFTLNNNNVNQAITPSSSVQSHKSSVIIPNNNNKNKQNKGLNVSSSITISPHKIQIKTGSFTPASVKQVISYTPSHQTPPTYIYQANNQMNSNVNNQFNPINIPQYQKKVVRNNSSNKQQQQLHDNVGEKQNQQQQQYQLLYQQQLSENSVFHTTNQAQQLQQQQQQQIQIGQNQQKSMISETGMEDSNQNSINSDLGKLEELNDRVNQVLQKSKMLRKQ